MQQFALRRQKLSIMPLVVRQPQRQSPGQTFATELLGRSPNGADHLGYRFILGFGAAGPGPPTRWQSVAQQLDGMFTAKAILLTKLVEQSALAWSGSPVITPAPFVQFVVPIHFSMHFHLAVLGVILP